MPSAAGRIINSTGTHTLNVPNVAAQNIQRIIIMNKNQKKSLMIVICWLSLIVVGVVIYAGFVNEWVRIILYFWALFTIGERFVSWLEK